MRIIAGDFKGRKLFTPKDDRIRPTTDKVKESLFSMITDYLEEAVVVDLFSGTGNLGLEAISRGASRCYFGDKSRESLQLTRQNISHCKVNEYSIAIQGEYDRVLRKIPEKVDVFFLDPPYYKGLIDKCIDIISELSLLREGGIIVAEHGADESLKENRNGLSVIKEKRYGAIAISIYRRNMEEQNE